MDTVSVHDLILDRALNPRLHGVDQDVVEFYAAIFHEVLWPPILVHRDSHKLLDGWHRVEAAKRAGVYTLPVQWVEAKEEELFALAVKSNLAHGVQLSREERFQAIARLQRESWTPERITAFLGCSPVMVKKTEKAEDLRVALKVQRNPGATLPIESLAELTRLPNEYHHELAELASELEAQPTDVRRTVKAIKKGLVESSGDIRKAMTDADFVKMREKNLALSGGDWLMTFATMVDQLEATNMTITAVEQQAAEMLFRRIRAWADRQLATIGNETSLTMM